MTPHFTPPVTPPVGGTPTMLCAGLLRGLRENVVGGDEDIKGLRESERGIGTVKVLVTFELERRIWYCSGEADKLRLWEFARSLPLRMNLWLDGGVVPVEYEASGSLLHTPLDESAEPYTPSGVWDDLDVDGPETLGRWRLHATSSDGK